MGSNLKNIKFLTVLVKEIKKADLRRKEKLDIYL